jgi:NADPH-dependent curcumin reductase CurA
MATNRKITLAARPVGYPKETDFSLVEEPIPVPGPGEMLVRIVYLSLDPYMRGMMSDRKSYARPIQIGEVMVGGTVGKVLQSNHPDYVKGDIVLSSMGWQEYAISDGTGLRKIDPQVAPISTALGVLGMPGLTACSTSRIRNRGKQSSSQVLPARLEPWRARSPS